MGGRAQAADRRTQVVRQTVGEQPQFLHQSADAIEHRIDLAAEAIEGVVGARNGYPLRQVAPADAIGDARDLADALADVVREDQSAQQAEQPGNHQRNQKRALKGVADRQAFTGYTAADQPLPLAELVHDEGRLARGCLAAQSDECVAVALARVEQRGGYGFEVALDLAPIRTDDGNCSLRIGVGQRVANGVVERRPAARAVDVGWLRTVAAASSCVR